MAAGLGFKTFTTGEVLTAADVNGYLMQGVLVFASAAARNAAITAPQEGQFAFTKDTNGLWYYDGAAWVASGATGDIEGVTAGVGISGGGTSGTVTITNDMATTITASGDIVVGTGSGTYDNLPIGTTGQVLTADTTVSPYKVKWATAASGMTNPMTTTGDTIYSSPGSTPVRLGIGSTGQVLTVSGGVPSWATPASGSTFSGASAYNTTDIAVADATTVNITYNSEEYDTDGYHSTSSNTNRLTIPSGKTGYFLLAWTVYYANNSTGYRNVNLLKNGTSVRQYSINCNTFGDKTTVTGSAIVSAAAGDYFNLQAFQNSGSSINLSGSSNPIQSFAIAFLGA